MRVLMRCTAGILVLCLLVVSAYILLPSEITRQFEEKLGLREPEGLAEQEQGTTEPRLHVVQGSGEVELLAELLAEGLLAHEDPVEFTLPYSPYIQDGQGDYLMQKISAAMDEVRREQPGLFWLGMGEYMVEWKGYSDRETLEVAVTFDYCYSQRESREVGERIDEVVQPLLVGAPSDPYEAAKYLHDWIVDNAVYDTAVSEMDVTTGYEYAFNIDGIFLEGKAVCEGYTKAYKLLCDELGIPCKIVFGWSEGENHAWNYVQVGSGWYLVDCTADDPVSTRDVLRWDYFLQGSESVAEGMRISERYVPDDAAYPVLSQAAYGGEQNGSMQDSRTDNVSLEFQVVEGLAEGSDHAQPGSLVGTIRASGNYQDYTFRLTGSGPDDHRFSLSESSGNVTVGSEPLTEGSYEVMVEVSNGDASSSVPLRFHVQSAQSAQSTDS